jgi:threonine dehydratase
MDLLKRILTAQVYAVAKQTPVEKAPLLSKNLDNEVFLKREDMQPVFSFKLRGAFNKIAQLSSEARDAGVVAASAGNHAQGVAMAAAHFGCEATIFMPASTPSIKVDSVRALGGTARLVGQSFDDAKAAALEFAQEHSLAFVHPFDDIDVIAGQGTVGMELVRQLDGNVDAVFVCVGGGGLIAGVSAYVKTLLPDTMVIGVEPEDSPTLHQALLAGEPVELEHVGLFADGASVKRIGDITFKIAKDNVDEVCLVDTDEICAAIKDMFEETRTVLEPAGALALAGAKKWLRRKSWSGKRVVAITSGANMNFDRLRFVAERAEVGSQREALFAVTVPEKPGSFRKFIDILEHRPITEFNYRFETPDQATLFVGVRVEGREERLFLLGKIREGSLSAVDITDDEIAKTHVRHMVGGRIKSDLQERIFDVTFREHPGAFRDFLSATKPAWNISLTHYRNQGGDMGRVLMGIQIPKEDMNKVDDFLLRAPGVWADVTDHESCKLFL